MLLQVLPASEEFTAEHTAEHFELLTQLTHTIKAEELFTLDTKEILHRLYHEEDVTFMILKLLNSIALVRENVVKIH